MSSSTLTSTSDASALSTVAGADIATAVRLAIGDSNSADYEFSNSELTTLLARAITYYQRFKPYVLITTITLVADQKDYALPSNLVKIKDHDYRTFAGVSSDTWITFNTLYGSPELVPYKDWSDIVVNRIREEFYARYDALGAGQGEVINYETSYAVTQYIRIFPTPTTGGDTFTVRYYANHPTQGNDYFTIPSSHSIYIQWLLEAEVADVRAAKMMSTANNFGAGTSRMDFAKSMKMLQDKAISLRQRVADALSYSTGRIA